MIQKSINTIVWKIRQDIQGFRFAVKPIAYPKTGLYTYNIEHTDGRTKRLHLRVEPERSGVLFVDVTDVIHLNPSAVLITKLALDKVPVRKTIEVIKNKHHYSGIEEIQDDVYKIYSMVQHLQENHEGCSTCALLDNFEMKPLFSVPVNAPYKVDLAITYGCNNACPHCYNESSRIPMPSLPLKDWFSVLDKLALLGIPHLIITGGEATMHPDLLEIIRYANDLGMIVGLNTNGRRLSHRPYMRSLVESGLNHVQITLGSCYAEIHNREMGSNSFDQTVGGIEAAVESGVHTITNTTLMRSNIDHAEKIIDFIKNLGVRTFAMNGMIYSGGGFAHPNAIKEEELPPLLVQMRDYAKEKEMRFLWYTPTEYCRFSPVEYDIGKKRCNAAQYSICIEPNGDVLPCQSFYVTAGNILHDKWETIWTSDLFKSFRCRVQDPQGTGLPMICWDCPDLEICGGGCRIEREAREGERTAEKNVFFVCSSGCGSGRVKSIDGEYPARFIPEGGYVPNASQMNIEKRASGEMPAIKKPDKE